MKIKGLKKILMMKFGKKLEKNPKIKIFFLKMQYFFKNLVKIHQMIKIIQKQF